MKMKVDYIIIGAGLSGIVLKHFLKNENTVIIDYNYGSYKIGESIIPEHFKHPELLKQVALLSQLPSYTPKYGSTFIADGSIASFPLPEKEAGVAMHIARSEMETAMIKDWNIDISKEKVSDIDFANKIVVTDLHEYEVSKQIIDCSGPAMVVARKMKKIKELWPVYATWRYFDVVNNDIDAFYSAVEDRHLDWRRYDAVHRRVLRSDEIRGWIPSRSTILSKIREGVWCWQIPLFDEKMLSFGVVSKSGPVSEKELMEAVKEFGAPNYTLAARKLDKSGDFNRLHVRNNFAKIADIPPGNKDYILVSDAYAFADPIYSVGTGLAVNKAIELAQILNNGEWDENAIEVYNNHYNEQLDRAIKGFNFWYDGQMMHDDSAAAEVQEHLLVGNVFQTGIAFHYGNVTRDADIADNVNDVQRDKFFINWFKSPVTQRVISALDLNKTRTVGNWVLGGAFPAQGGIVMRWRHLELPELSVMVSDEKTEGIEISFMSYFDNDYPTSHKDFIELMDHINNKVNSNDKLWVELLK